VEACVALRDQHRAMAFRSGPQSPYAYGLSIGLDSGHVIFGGLGGPDLGRLDYTVLGDVTDTAAQLAAMAKRDQLLIPDHLRQHLAGVFECRTIGTQRLPSSVSAVPVFNIVGRYGEMRPADDYTPSPEVAEPPTQPEEGGLAALTGR
jgi:class 3 adenylate cyclase